MGRVPLLLMPLLPLPGANPIAEAIHSCWGASLLAAHIRTQHGHRPHLRLEAIGWGCLHLLVRSSPCHAKRGKRRLRDMGL